MTGTIADADQFEDCYDSAIGEFHMVEKASTAHFAIGSTIAVEALKALLLVNGGAATALIALTNKTHGGSDYSIAVLLFGCAALLNSFTLVIGYFSQLAYANHVLAIEDANTHNADTQIAKHRRLQYLAIGILFVSMTFSVGGMATAFRAT